MKGRALIAAVRLLMLSPAALGLVRPHTEYAAVLRKNGSTPVLGVATMEASPDNKATLIMVQFKGEKAGTVHPWSVHIGNCAKPGKIWGDSASYLPVTADDKGFSKRKIEIALPLPDTGDFYISIQEPAGKPGKVFACVDFYLED